tara:strand:+ start:2141 stop:2734 length:594 start_codon:yes stop_codon:yes gene_type:complete
MPYTKDELQNVSIYTEFRDRLRGEYIENLIQAALKKFRNEDGVLLSYEDIVSRDGIENAQLSEPEYSTLEGQLNRATIEETTGYTNFQNLIEEESYSIQTDVIKATNKDRMSDKLVDRNISELLQIDIIDPLPDGLENGDTITSDDVTDVRKWLIDGNQKRPFPDLQTFYAIGSEWRNVKTKTMEIIDSIPEGEPVD